MELQELFRNKLDEAEIIPDPAVNVRLMKKLARREFVTFNPSRFNSYYLGGIIAAGIAAAVLLYPDDQGSTQIPDENVNQVSTVVQEKPAVVYENKEADKPEIKSETNQPGKPESPSRKKDAIAEISEKKTSESHPSLSGQTDHISAKVKNDILIRETDSDKLVISSKSSERLFLSSVTEGCVPLKVRFVSTVNGTDSYRWTFGDGGVSHDKTPEWIFDVDGEYKVTLEVYSGNNLIGEYSEVIKVKPRPVANFEITPERAVIPDDEIRFINYSTEAVRYLWNFGDGNSSGLFEPQYRYSQYGQYNVKLTVFNEFGCSDSILVENAFAGSAYFIEFPNAFIPNPDGPSGGIYSLKSDETAEVFHPAYSGVSDYQLKIFSKLGILIFESNDINIGWDGYFKGQLSKSGVYIWKVRGKYRNGEPFTKMGDVTLLKN